MRERFRFSIHLRFWFVKASSISINVILSTDWRAILALEQQYRGALSWQYKRMRIIHLSIIPGNRGESHYNCQLELMSGSLIDVRAKVFSQIEALMGLSKENAR